MPSSAERPTGSRPWWRVPLPAQDDAVSDGQPGSAPGSRPEPAPAVSAQPTELMSPPVGPMPPPAGPTPPAAGPSDTTMVMAPVPADATRELPPVPADPAGLVPLPPSSAGPLPAGMPSGRAPYPSAPEGGLHPAPGRPGMPVPPPGAAEFPARPVPPAGTFADQGVTDRGVADAAADEPPGRPRADRRTGLITGGGVILVLVLVLAGAGLLVSRLRNTTSPGSPGASATAVDLHTVRASASSTQKADGNISYTPGNTLDGNPATAWNSDGSVDGPGPGITLSYTFGSPVNLRAITIRNGYQKVRSKGVDLWERNERVRQLQITTDSGNWTWDLEDIRDPQTLDRDFGRTTTVKLKIVSVYPGTKYKDVAISEVSFGAAP
ncbi:MAG TPA: hypothetical protein VFP72_25120 [Kineosporiaceae bacterium]|nr:hypothetical protein [Kineosporiaceae bacterium]